MVSGMAIVPTCKSSDSRRSHRSGRHSNRHTCPCRSASFLAVVLFALGVSRINIADLCWIRPRSGLGSTQRAAATSDVNQDASKSARRVRILSEKNREVILRNATVAWMDQLMRAEAVDVLAAGAERSEKVKGKEGLWHAYMKETKMGTWRNQVRLTCTVQLSSTGAVDVNVVSFEVGTPDESGDMVFTEYDPDTFRLEWKNKLTWREKRGEETALSLVHSSSGQVDLVLPWWFPLPDVLVRATFRAAVQYMVSDGQSKVVAALAARHEQTQAK